MARSSTSAASAAPNVHFVVDGSNIATEGRNAPSLRQLNEAVLAFMDEHPGALITVVVDATFGHRIDKSEVREFDDAVANNELVTPPAGAVGRGDAFVLSIANKANAGILSNDSFQEFHGTYDWLFEPGRLIGGKPVPHVGWVFVERTPVRGPKSRQSVKDAKRAENGETPAPRRRGRRTGTASGSPLANEPMPVPTAPPPGRARAEKAAAVAEPEGAASAPAASADAPVPPSGRQPVNDLVPFLDFVERHPVGTSCTAVVESYSSHGAYARVDTVLVYVPLRLMDDPPPRSARSLLRLGDAVTLVVVGYAPERRSIDAALPNMAPAAGASAPTGEEPTTSRRKRRAAATVAAADASEVVADPSVVEATVDAGPGAEPPAEETTASPPTSTRSSRSRRKAASPRAGSDVAPAEQPTTPGAGEQAPAATPPAKRTRTKRASATPPAAEEAAATQTPATKARAKKATAKTATAKKAATKKAAAKKAAPKTAAAKTSAHDQATTEQPTKQAAATTTAAKQTAKKAAAKSSAAKQTAKKSPAKQTAKKATAKKATAKRSGATGDAG